MDPIFEITAAIAPPEPGAPLPSAIVWMPEGVHKISAGTVGGGTYSGKVICDAQAGRAIKESFSRITAGGRRVYLDFNHEEGAAAAWVKRFDYVGGLGIIAHVEWTAGGEAALRGKTYYSFSPSFSCERETGRVVSLLPGKAAGGIVNSPAFDAMPALIAAKYDDAHFSAAVELAALHARTAGLSGADADNLRGEIMELFRAQI